MNNKYISIIVSLFIAILFSSCQHMQTRNNSQQNKKSRSVIYLEKAISNHDKKISELTFQLKQVNENNNILTGEINKLIKKSSSQQQQITLLETKSLLLGKALDAERKNRHSETEQLLKEIAQQTTEAINSSSAALLQKQRPQNSKNSKGPATKGSFYEYKVQPGATLGAIAKAYKVSVNDIKKANRLKNDIIRVGQTLYIPKK